MKSSKLFTSLKLTCTFSMLFILSACSFAPEYVAPTLDLPQEWSAEKEDGQNISKQWWKRFDDPVLDQIIETTLANNYNLLIAAEQIVQAQAYLGITRADLFPTLSGTGGLARSQSSVQAYEKYKDTALSYLLSDRVSNSVSLGLSAAWELDFWGKYRNATAAAREQLIATEYGQQALLLEVTAQTAVAYFTLLSLDEQLEVSYRTLKTREEALRIYHERYKEGLINELDYLRASTEVDTVKTTIFTLTYQIDNAETALQVLMGQSPREIFAANVERGLTLSQLPTTPQLPTGVPSELLTRRPDILAAEANLRAANFNIGVAKAEWFPSISLTGSLGMSSVDLDRLFTGAAGFWSYGASLTTPIFNMGRISSNIAINESLMREAVLKYQQTVQTAFQDVYKALSVQENIGNVVDSLRNTVKALDTSAQLARLRYDNGYASYLEVLDAERSLFDAEIQLANARSQHLSTLVYICQALGGGWTDPGEQLDSVVNNSIPATKTFVSVQ